MKKTVLLGMICLCALASCSKDEPDLPKLNKLTRVICYQNGEQQPAYTVVVNYKSDGGIATIQYNGETRQFIYVGNTITVSGPTDPVSEEYTINNTIVASKKVSRKNPYAANVIYVSDEYTYNYSKANQTSTDWVTRWPLADGSGYDTRTYRSAENYNWADGNITRFTEDKKEIAYTYGALARPVNFPLRVINTFRPVAFESIHPMNLSYGTQNKLLPERAYWYNIPETSVICAEYEFKYTFTSEYVTGMTVTEKNHIVDGGGDNTYEYVFEYNYVID